MSYNISKNFLTVKEQIMRKHAVLGFAKLRRKIV